MEEPFDKCMYLSDGNFCLVFHGCSSFLVVVVSDHFSNDPAVTPIKATGYQLVTLCRSICAEEGAQVLEPLLGSKVLLPYHPRMFLCVCSPFAWLITGLDDVWTVLRAWSRTRHVLCPTHLKPLIQAAMNQKGVKREEETVRCGALR